MKCEICGSVFSTLEQFVKHFNEEHSEITELEPDDTCGCPHCGSKTKHKSWCPDQQIINAFKELKSIDSDTFRSKEEKP